MTPKNKISSEGDNKPSHKNPSKEDVEKLHNKIKQGADGKDDVIESLGQIHGKALIDYCHKNQQHNTDGTRGTKDTLLHTAALYQEDNGILEQLVTQCPCLVTKARTGDWEGQTALHITLSKGNDSGSKFMVENVGGDQLETLFASMATGSKFKDTVLMGQSPLSVAALTFNKDMVSYLLDKGDRISRPNSLGDTAIHSLIKFAAVQREKTPQVVDMLNFLDDKLRHSRPREDPRAVWYKANGDKLSALKLAAHLGQLDTFSAILRLDRVYRVLESHDGVKDTHRYDVTEIDPLTQRMSEFNKLKTELKGGHLQVCGLKARLQSCRPLSVLEIICSRRVKQAHGLVNVDVVKDIIRKKWIWYRKMHYAWAVFHLAFMVLLSTYGILKTKVITSDNNAGGNSTTNGTTHQQHRAFTDGSAWAQVVYAAVIILFELRRSLYLRQWWHWRLPHHNAWYRTTLILFSLSLVVDFGLHQAGVDNQIPLLLALLIGWWFLTFFLRSVKKFSFYTVMFQKVLSGDLPRSCSIIVLELFSFSLAMFITIRAEPQRPEFKDIWSTLLTMFNLMLGLGDIDLLYEARELWLAVILYVMFILITYLLLINSLIAMMSKTCNSVSDHRDAQWDLQRLSLILFLESTLVHRLQLLPLRKLEYVPQNEKIATEFDERRFYHRFSSHQTNTPSDPEWLQAARMISTFSFPGQMSHDHIRQNMPTSSSDMDKSNIEITTPRLIPTFLNAPIDSNESSNQPPVHQLLQLIPVTFNPGLAAQTSPQKLSQEKTPCYLTGEIPINQPPIIVPSAGTSVFATQPVYCILVQPSALPATFLASQTQLNLPRPENDVHWSGQRPGSGHQRLTSGNRVKKDREAGQKQVWMDINDLDSEAEFFHKFQGKPQD